VVELLLLISAGALCIMVFLLYLIFAALETIVAMLRAGMPREGQKPAP
jgi:SNF family Na+-dependent transporter